MAALVAGIQYGLSSHNSFYENKSLIFVKLTDSAQRTINEYIQNKNKIRTSPTIQFLGNEGCLSFPSFESSYGNFIFGLSNNQDIEGPQGGFECVQQTGPTNLENLGALPCKMRIQANDDVYETTRHRMHAAEENNKNKCTRVIKANEPVGRKVKVKGNVVVNPSSHRISSNSSTKPRDSLTSVNLVNNSFKSTVPSKLVHNNHVNVRLQNDNLKKLPDVMRKPLKERLVHLLALRPFKRPELYDRINKDGVREKEKNIMANLLKQIAFMRDNTYHLNRCMWNDVQEDWPFYTEQERAILKRRKPQNLTPPGSSDGSSNGSGQSPNSIHPGSPPTITALPFDVFGSKRPGYYQGNDGLPTKRQRISHYRKIDPDLGYSASSDSTRLNITANSNTKHDQKQLQDSQQRDYEQKSLCIIGKSNDLISSDTDDVDATVVSTSSKHDTVNDHLFSIQNSYDTFDGTSQSDKNLCQYPEHNRKNLFKKAVNNNNNELSYSLAKEPISSDDFLDAQISSDKDKNNVKSSLLNVSGLDISNEFNSGNNRDSFFTISTSHSFPEISNDLKYLDYSNQYTTINSLEQRTRYKAEFNAYYKEYRKLHIQVVKISEQFSHLKDRLKEKSDNGNLEGYEEIKTQILEEYSKTKNINARFYYLHGKLGCIKKLVSDYDAHTNRDSSSYTENEQPNSLNCKSVTFHGDIEETQCVFTQLPVEQPLTYCSKIP